ncbi:MAG TPA: hypothetical protein PLK68_06485 [Thomasclavelia ramosa]|nr:hypothetical protein [Thomasclavelia ramosa]
MRVNEQAVKNILKSVGNAKLVAATKYVGIDDSACNQYSQPD